MLQGRYQYRPPLPFTVGSECSGVIIEVGSKVSSFRVGDGVIAGMTSGDSMASEIVRRAEMLIKKPPQMTHSEAAGLPVGFFTTYHALVHRGHVKAGEILLVTGAGGGMGLSAVQLGRKLGCTVIAAASSEEKCQQALKAGAHHAINYSNLSDLKTKVSELTSGKFADVIYEVVGGDVFKECIRCIAPNGRLLVIGFASGAIPSVPANMVLVKGFSLVGVRSGQEMIEHPELTAEMVAAMNAIADEGRDRSLAPIVVNVPVDRFRDAYNLILTKKVIGKACVLWQPEEKAKL